MSVVRADRPDEMLLVWWSQKHYSVVTHTMSDNYKQLFGTVVPTRDCLNDVLVRSLYGLCLSWPAVSSC